MTLRKLLLGTAIALVMFSPAFAASECVAVHDNYETLTVHGTIVETKMPPDGLGSPYKSLAIVLDEPHCGTPNADTQAIGTDFLATIKNRIVEVSSSVSKKWLGHHVVVTAEVQFSGGGPVLDVKHINDSK